MPKTILMVDDRADLMKQLADQVAALLQPGDDAQIIQWTPTAAKDSKPIESFQKYLQDNDVRLVITDYDLTENGVLGLFGATVVDWSQAEQIPVGDFSRGHKSLLASEPNMFEIRVPSDAASARYIAAVFRGFVSIRERIDASPELSKRRSPAAALATLLGAKNSESQFAQYGIRYGGANSSLLDRVVQAKAAEQQSRLLTYIMGHLLLNAVLKFPGPILSAEALAAYLATDKSMADQYKGIFESAKYDGPFASLDDFYWTEKVDTALQAFDKLLAADTVTESSGEERRMKLEKHLKTSLQVNYCTRCQGRNGGYLCPFTRRPVCERADCSVASNGWIPAGARFSRCEKDFYLEWAPVLGM